MARRGKCIGTEPILHTGAAKLEMVLEQLQHNTYRDNEASQVRGHGANVGILQKIKLLQED